MLFKSLGTRKKPRKFGYKPQYYKPDDVNEEEDDEDERRIHFHRIRQGAPVSKRSLRSMLVMLAFLLFCLFYFWGTIGQEVRVFNLEDVRIEGVPLIQ